MQKLLTVMLLVCCMAVYGQTKFNGTVKGLVFDSLTNSPLQGATIVVPSQLDSATAAYGISDSTGRFELQKIGAGAFILGISFTGFAESLKTLHLRQPNLFSTLVPLPCCPIPTPSKA